MKVVVDASVALKWVLRQKGEADADVARSLLEMIDGQSAIMAQPPHWLSEVLAVVARLEPDRIDDIVPFLARVPHTVLADLPIHQSAAHLAARLDHHLFDTFYHAIGLAIDATLITADERYFAKAKHLGRIALLRDFPIP